MDLNRFDWLAWDASGEVRNGHSRPFAQMMGTKEFHLGARRLGTATRVYKLP